MGAEGSQAGISYIKEVTLGVTPTGQFTGINFDSEDMAKKIENKASNSIRPDRQTSDLVQVAASVEGGFETEMRATNIDPLFPHFIWDTDWVQIGDSSSTITAGATASNLDFVFASSGNTLTLGSSVVFDIVDEQFITIAGTTSNNGTFFVSGVSGSVLTLLATLTDETVESTATIKGDRTRNGIVRSSYSIERSNNDASQFFLYRGMVPNTIEFTLEGEEPAKINLGFVGMDEALSQATTSSPSASALVTTPVMNSTTSVGSITIDNVEVESCALQKADFKFDNQATGKTALGTLGFCNITGKSIEVTGNLALYFIDETYYDKYLASDTFGLSFVMTDSLGNTYTFNLPKCKFNEATANVTGKDDDVMLEGTFTAIVGSEGYTLQITKAVV